MIICVTINSTLYVIMALYSMQIDNGTVITTTDQLLINTPDMYAEPAVFQYFMS